MGLPAPGSAAPGHGGGPVLRRPRHCHALRHRQRLPVRRHGVAVLRCHRARGKLPVVSFAQRVYRWRRPLHAPWHHGKDSVPVHAGDVRNPKVHRPAAGEEAMADDRRLNHRRLYGQRHACGGGQPQRAGHTLARQRSERMVGRALPGQVARQRLPLGCHQLPVRSVSALLSINYAFLILQPKLVLPRHAVGRSMKSASRVLHRQASTISRWTTRYESRLVCLHNIMYSVGLRHMPARSSPTG